MDEYGHSAAAKTAILVFEAASRGSGRTARMIERVSDEDQIVVPNGRVSEYVQRELRRAGKKSRVIVIDPKEVPMSRAGTAPRGRTWFEHTWTKAFFEGALEQASRDLEHFQRAMSKTWPEAPQLDASGERMEYEYRSGWKD